MNLNEEKEAINNIALNEWKEIKKDFVETTDRIKDFCEYKVNEWVMTPEGKEIDAAGGKASFVKTEIEDEQGKWNDNYYTKDGYYVIHRGKEHDVYKLKENIGSAIDKVGSTVQLVKEDMGPKGNTDIEIDGKTYNVDYKVDYHWSGRAIPASESGPAEFPDLEIDNITFSNVIEYGNPDKNIRWEDIPKDIQVKIDDKFSDMWREEFVETQEDPDYDDDDYHGEDKGYK